MDIPGGGRPIKLLETFDTHNKWHTHGQGQILGIPCLNMLIHLLETFDTCKKWRTHGEGHILGISCPSSSSNSARLPRRARNTRVEVVDGTGGRVVV